MKIGIYGGSFDPIHLGHLNLATEMLEAHHLDEVWFCPAANNPFKPLQSATPSFHRLNMLRLAIENEPRFLISEIEMDRGGVSYTIDTLKELHAKNGQHRFFLILGEDAARGFHQWHQPEAIIQLAQPLIGCRGCKMDKLAPFEGSPKVVNALTKGLTPTRIMEISGTEIRKRILEKKNCYHLVPGKVMDYILTNRIYYSVINEARFL
jgi:nicotinate-nucleotide adenylyltransferase